MWVWNDEEQEFELAAVSEEEKQKVIEDGLAIESMKMHHGWKVVQAAIEDSINGIKESLIHEADYKRLRRLQERANAYQSILTFMQVAIDHAKALSDKQDPSIEG